MFRLLVVIFFSSLQVFGQMPGDLVSSFGNNGKVIVDYGDLDACNDVVLDTSGNIYFAGASTTFGNPNNTDFVLGKLNSFGQIDLTFGINGFYSGDFPKSNASTIHEIRLVDDGLILFGSGIKYGVADTQYLFVSKVDYNGQIDTTFSDSGTFSGVFLTSYNYPGSILIQNNGKVVVCGSAYDSLLVQDVPIIGRLNADGSPDTSYSSTGFKYWDMTGPLQNAKNLFPTMPKHGAGGFFDDVLLMDNGNYFFSGFYSSGTTIHCLMAMIDSSGNFVPTFGSNGFLIFQHSPSFENKIVKSMKYNNSILLGIYVDNLTPNQDFIIQEIDMNGSLINMFTTDFNGQRDEIKDMSVGNEGFFIAGYSTVPNNIQNGYASDFFTLAKYKDVNVLDTPFASNGLFQNNFNVVDETGSTCIDVLAGRIVVGGYLNNLTGSNITDFGFMMVYDDEFTGTEKKYKESMVNIYPNPVENYVVVNSKKGIKSLSIFNSMGNEVIDYSITQGRIDVSKLSKGVYIIKVVSNSGNQITRKVLIQ